VAAYAFAWLVGFLVPLAPDGLGLRDGLIAVSLGPGAAIALRIAATLGELAAFLAVELTYRLRGPRARPGDA